MSTTPLLFQRRFLPMWLAQNFGALADNMNRQVLLIGVPFGIINLSGFETSDDAIPLIGALFPIAMLIGSLYGGQIAEKVETARMFRLTKLAELGLMGLAALGLLSGQGWFIVAALFGMGLQSAFFNPVRQAAMPKYLSTQELVRGNGLCNAGIFTCILLGYGIGGYLIGLEEGAYFWTALVLVAFSVLGLVAAWATQSAPATNPSLVLDFNPARQFAQIAGFAWQEKSVLHPLAGAAFFYFVSTGITVLLPIYTRDTLGANPFAATIIMLIFAIGALFGASAAVLLSKGRSGFGFSGIGIFCAGLSGIGVVLAAATIGKASPEAPLRTVETLFFTPSGAMLAAALLGTSAFMGMFLVPLQAAVQRRAPSARRARILAFGNILNAITAFLGSLSILGVTRTGFDPNAALFIVSVALFAVAGYMLWRRGKIEDGLYDQPATLSAGQAPALPG